MKSYRICKCGNRTTSVYCSLKCLMNFKYAFDIERDKDDFIEIVNSSTSMNQVTKLSGIPRDRAKELLNLYRVNLKERKCLTCGKKINSSSGNKDKRYCDSSCRYLDKYRSLDCKYKQYPEIKKICSKMCTNPSYKHSKIGLKQTCCICGTEFIASSTEEFKVCSYECLVKIGKVILEARSGNNGKEA